MKRRDLLRGAAAAAACTGPWRSAQALSGSPRKAAGLQLYTVRNELAKDVAGTLAKVAAIGYKEVEVIEYGVFDFNGKSAKELGKILRDNGLVAPSCHYAQPQPGADWSRYIADATELGVKYMVNAMGPSRARSLDDYKRLVDVLLKAAEETQKAGIRFCYHNHNFEFKRFGDTTAYDFLLRELDPRLVSFEMDCFWVTHAGRDPVAYFKKHPGRFPLLHIKDLKAGNPSGTELDDRLGLFAEVGNGTIAWKRIFEAAPEGGMKHCYVEQDFCERPATESIEMSYRFLQRLRGS